MLLLGDTEAEGDTELLILELGEIELLGDIVTGKQIGRAHV